jgi:hypothetical protein
VGGRSIAVTATPGRYQCADTETIARGRGIAFPIAAHPSVYELRVIAFIGVPCPKNIAGMDVGMTGCYPKKGPLPARNVLL